MFLSLLPLGGGKGISLVTPGEVEECIITLPLGIVDELKDAPEGVSNLDQYTAHVCFPFPHLFLLRYWRLQRTLLRTY